MKTEVEQTTKEEGIAKKQKARIGSVFKGHMTKAQQVRTILDEAITAKSKESKFHSS